MARPPLSRLGKRLARRSPLLRFAQQLVDLRRLGHGAAGLASYAGDYRAYARTHGAERIRWRDLNPQVHDRVTTTPFDPHYLYQDAWAARKVAQRSPSRHVDVASRIDVVAFLAAITDVVFVDIRPVQANIPGLTSVSGTVLGLPFADESVASLSCLHVVEHIGLGRYGDPLDPLGSRKAATELQRVVEPGGDLLFSCPVGKPRLCFNAHRIHAPGDILRMFNAMTLEDFAGVDDEGVFHRKLSPAELSGSEYACGLFHFRKPGAATSG